MKVITTKRYTGFDSHVDMVKFIDNKFPDLSLDKVYGGYSRDQKHYFEIKTEEVE